MPELPEVETLRRALIPLVQNKHLLEVIFHRPDLRFPIPQDELIRQVKNQVITGITRRGKYLLFHVREGAMLWHLGMSGRAIRYDEFKPVKSHTHAVFHFEPNIFLHFIDPRRFGSILWVPRDQGHPLLDHLGPDPFSNETNPEAMKSKAQRCKGTIKNFLMNARRLAGVGNIYACEALFVAGMNPQRPAYRLSLKSWENLLTAIRQTLEKSIASGGTTLRDFYNPEGNSGYFSLELAVYGREGEPCRVCQAPIYRKIHTARSTFYCPRCQKN